MMELKRVDVPFEYQDSVEVIQPLEETYYDDGEYKYVTRPTEPRTDAHGVHQETSADTTMTVNCTKYDLCVCGHKREDHHRGLRCSICDARGQGCHKFVYGGKK